jgi:DNA (cytosine-5)-methyltransferase 1
VVRKGGRLPHDRQPTNRRMHGVRNTTAYFEQAKRLQGLPPEWDLPGFTVAAKIRALGTAVPLPMARALARAVRQALELA